MRTCGLGSTPTKALNNYKMKTSESVTKIIGALVEFQSKAPKILKNANNPFFKSKYATLGDILTLIQPILSECKLVVLQVPTTQNELITRIYHESGEFIEGSYLVNPIKADPQSLGSAITYARRYAITSMLNLNIDDDDDGNAASGNNVPTTQKAYSKEVLSIEKPSQDKIKTVELMPTNDNKKWYKVEFITGLSGIICSDFELELVENQLLKFTIEKKNGKNGEWNLINLIK